MIIITMIAAVAVTIMTRNEIINYFKETRPKSSDSSKK